MPKKRQSNKLDFRFITKDDKLIIEMLNKRLGTKYRTIPYDLKNLEDWKELLVEKSAELMDFFFYSIELNTMLERVDESIEVFRPVEWAVGWEEPSKFPATKAYNLLRRTANQFDDYVSGLIEQVRSLWIFAFEIAPQEVLDSFNLQRLEQDEVKKLLDDNFMLFILENRSGRPYTEDELATEYINCMKLRWAAIQEGKDYDYGL